LSTYQLQDNNDDSFLQARSESIENAKNALQSFKTEAPILIGECKSQTDQLIQLHQIVDQKPADSTAQQAMLLVQRKAIEEQKIKNSYYLNRINAQLLLIETLTNTAKP
jgi:tRNA splicing ligase